MPEDNIELKFNLFGNNYIQIDNKLYSLDPADVSEPTTFIENISEEKFNACSRWADLARQAYNLIEEDDTIKPGNIVKFEDIIDKTCTELEILGLIPKNP